MNDYEYKAKSLSSVINESSTTQKIANGVGKIMYPAVLLSKGATKLSQAIKTRNTKSDNDENKKIRYTALGALAGHTTGWLVGGPIGGVIGSGIGGYAGLKKFEYNKKNK